MTICASRFRRFSLATTALFYSSMLFGAEIASEHIPGAETWFSTFSIIVYDPATNELGVGVQSRAFGAGAAVPYAKAGVGAVATQAATNRTYGPKAIALLEKGLSPAEVVKQITDEDPGRDRRQVAVIDVKGRIAAYTGKNVIDRNSDPKDYVHIGGWAGSAEGTNVSVQGNTLASEEVILGMKKAYLESKGEMAERLIDALDAGQAAGGDIRGMQAAGIVVVRPITDPTVTTDHYIDVRVDDAPDPFKELRRVLNVRLSGDRAQRATKLAEEGKFPEALAAQELACKMNPTNERLRFQLAERSAQAGNKLDALIALREAIAKQPRLKPEAKESKAFASIKDAPEFIKLVGP